MADWSDEFEELIRRHCQLLPAGAPLDGDAALTSLGMDSLEVVEFIVSIEDTFDLTIPEELLTPQVFATTNTIWRAVDRLCAEVAR